MTTYEKLKQLLNDASLQQTLTDHLACDKVRLNLYEEDDNHYILDVQAITKIVDEDLVIYTETFEFKLTNRDTLDFFIIRFGEFVSPSQALETARLGQIIENRLKSFL